MQNSIDFLRNQQSDILERLHVEIERLKAENKGMVLPCDRFRVAPMWSISFCYPFLETQVRLCYDLQSWISSLWWREVESIFTEVGSKMFLDVFLTPFGGKIVLEIEGKVS